MCRSSRKSDKPVKAVDEVSEPQSGTHVDSVLVAYTSRNAQREAFKQDVVNETWTLPMEIDTGAGVSLLPTRIYDQWKKESSSCPALQATGIQLRSYTGDTIQVAGEVAVNVRKRDDSQAGVRATLVVVQGRRPPLLGRDLMALLGMSINSIPEKPAKVGKPSRLSEILERYEDVFGDDLGCCKGPSVSILVQQDAAPRFMAVRSTICLEPETGRRIETASRRSDH